MLLSKPQKSLLNFLRLFGVLREDQAERFLRMEYRGLRLEPLLRQLVCGGLIRRENGFLLDPEGNPEYGALEAVDVMLLLEKNHIPLFQRGAYPFSLTFFKERQGKLWRYDVCRVKPGMEPVICAALERISPGYRMLVFLLERPEQQPGITVPCECSFAWMQDGQYRFYKQERRI